jgi:hypothetical protein
MTCPACRYVNEDDAQFCEQCGQTLAILCPACGSQAAVEQAPQRAVCAALLEHIAATRVLLVCTYRPDFASLWSCKSYHSVITLRPLESHEGYQKGCLFSSRAGTLYQLLLPYARRTVVIGNATACYGAASRYLWMLATTMVRWEEAEQHFTDALAMNTNMGARPLLHL